MSNLFEIIPNQRTVDIMRLDGIQWSFQENVTCDDIKSDKKKRNNNKAWHSSDSIFFEFLGLRPKFFE